MRNRSFVVAAMVAVLFPAAGWADDPRDPAMRNAAARARDAETVRRLNLAENDAVVKRGVRWHVVGDDAATGDAGYTAATHDHARAVSDYAHRRTRYERDLADWHRAVTACRAGDYAACDN